MEAHVIIILLLSSLLLVFSSSASTSSTSIKNACKASREPKACKAWLNPQSSSLPNKATALDVIQLAVKLANGDLQNGSVYIERIHRDSQLVHNLNRSSAAEICKELLTYSSYRIDMVNQALRQPNNYKYTIRDARTWMSGVLVYASDCWSALKYVNDSKLVVETMEFFNNTMIQGTSNVVAMLFNYDVQGPNTSLWGPPRTERDGFWDTSPPYKPTWDTRIPKGLKPNVTVCQKGRRHCDYSKVQDAVKAAPNFTGHGKFYVIQIKEGVYNEIVRIGIEKTNLVFSGDGMGKTVITGSMSVQQPGVTTFATATVGVSGDGFIARNLTIENTSDNDAQQAVAYRTDSDKSILENCELIGNQDTLYTHSLRQYYSNCHIVGNVDFIFGNAAAFFHGCQILVAERVTKIKKEGGVTTNAVTAQGRTDPGQPTGFVFWGSVINGTEGYMHSFLKNKMNLMTFLGRPWKMYSRTVFIECTLEALISPEGWMPWNKDGFALDTLYYGEYKNSGPGANTSKRVTWSTRMIPGDYFQTYTVPNFIQAMSNY